MHQTRAAAAGIDVGSGKTQRGKKMGKNRALRNAAFIDQRVEGMYLGRSPRARAGRAWQQQNPGGPAAAACDDVCSTRFLPASPFSPAPPPARSLENLVACLPCSLTCKRCARAAFQKYNIPSTRALFGIHDGINLQKDVWYLLFFVCKCSSNGSLLFSEKKNFRFIFIYFEPLDYYGSNVMHQIFFFSRY